MDGVHCMGPGAIMFALAEHFRLTGDLEWLKANAPRMKANAEWILRQRRLLANNIPGGQRLWCKGLQPAHVVTPDSVWMHMQFYETEAYYWLAVKSMAEMLARIDPAEGAKMAAEAEAYRKDLVAAIDRSIALTPVVAVRDGTYHSFIPFAPYVRGFAAGAWGWRRCQGHVGAIYWDTVQSADPLVSPAGLLSPGDRRVQGHLDVLEDRLLLENPRCPRERPASTRRRTGSRTRAGSISAAWSATPTSTWRPTTCRTSSARCSTSMPWTSCRASTPSASTPPAGRPTKSTRNLLPGAVPQMLVMEEGECCGWRGRRRGHGWSRANDRRAQRPHAFRPGRLRDRLRRGSRPPDGHNSPAFAKPAAPGSLVLRHPASAAIAAVRINGKDWADFDAARGWIRLHGLSGQAKVEVRWADRPVASSCWRSSTSWDCSGRESAPATGAPIRRLRRIAGGRPNVAGGAPTTAPVAGALPRREQSQYYYA